MKAIRVHEFGGPGVMRLEDVPDPSPGAHQVVVEIKAVGVNPVETYIRSGSYPVKPQLPYTPGSDAAGIVAHVGEGVRRVQPGDRVYTAGTISGTYAQFALCEEAQVRRLPEHVTFEGGAAIGVPYGTAYRALFQKAQAQPGELVLVHGASGGVGIAAVQLARAAGLTVIGTGGTEQGRKLIAEQGAHYVLDHRAPNYLDELPDLTGQQGVDVILEMLANVNLNQDLNILARGGRVVVVGSRGPVEINPRAAMSRDASIIGMTLMNATRSDLEGIHAALVAGLENNSLRPVINERIPLAEAARAHEAVMQSGAHGKIILLP